MICNLTQSDLAKLLEKQLSNFFVLNEESANILNRAIAYTLPKLEENFTSRNNKYYKNGKGEACFSTNNSDQYAIFLYYLCNGIYRESIETQDNRLLEIAEQLYYLNKIMHSVNWFYAIDLPTKFGGEHPVGSVLGRANYGENLYIYQGVTIGGSFNKNGHIEHPTIGNNVTIFANASVLGDCYIGNNVVIAASTQLINKIIPDNSIVFGTGNDITIKPNNFEINIWMEKK